MGSSSDASSETLVLARVEEDDASLDKKLDSIIGKLEPYQIWILFLLGIQQLPKPGFTFGIPVFSMATPEFECESCVSNLDSDARSRFEPFLYEARESSCNKTVTYNHCSIRESVILNDTNNTMSYCDITNSTGLPNNIESSKMVECQNFVYNRSQFNSTVVTEYQLLCDRAWLKSTAITAFFFGIIFGVSAGSTIANKYGRKVAIILGSFTTTISGFITASSSNVWIYIVGRFLNGFGTFVYTSCLYAMSSECLAAETRYVTPIICSFLYCMGSILAAIIGYYIRDWRSYEYTLAAISTVTSLTTLVIDEGYRWHLARGDYHSARPQAHKMARLRDSSYDAAGLDKVLEAIARRARDSTKFVKRDTMFNLNKYPLLRNYWANIVFQIMAVAVIWVGVLLNTGKIPGSIYMNYAVYAIMELIGYTGGPKLSNHPKLGRRQFHVSAMLCVGVFLAISTILLEISGCSDQSWYIKAGKFFGYMAYFAICMQWCVILTTQMEAVSVEIRTHSYAAACVFARILMMILPYFLQLGDTYPWLPSTVFSCVALLASWLAMYLPETKGQPNFYTMEEAEKYYRNKLNATKTVSK